MTESQSVDPSFFKSIPQVDASQQQQITQETKAGTKCMIPPARQLITRRWIIYSIIITCIAFAILLIVLSGTLFSQNQNISNFPPATPPVTWQAKSPLVNVAPGFLLMSPQYFYTLSFTGNLFLFATTTLGGRPVWSTDLSSSFLQENKYREKKVNLDDEWEENKEEDLILKYESKDKYLEHGEKNENYVMNYLEFKQNSSKFLLESKLSANNNNNNNNNNKNLLDEEIQNKNKKQNDETNYTTLLNNVYTRTLNLSTQGVLFIRDETTQQIVWRSTPSDNPTGTYYLQVLDSGTLQIVTNQGIQIWSVDMTTVTNTFTNYSLPGNRILLSNSNLKNGPYTLLFDGNSGTLAIYQMNVNPKKVVWTSSSSSSTTTTNLTSSIYFTCSFTKYGNLLIFNNDKQTIWSSNTASLINSTTSSPDNLSDYNLNLTINGIMQLDYQGRTYFQTTTTSTSSLTLRQPAREFSRSSPFYLFRQNVQQIIIESSDLLCQLVFEPDGRITLYARNLPTLPYNILSATREKGDILYLYGLQENNLDLVGKLVLLSISSDIPIWIFAPNILITNPSVQLPVTLCFNNQNRLSIISQDQEILVSQSSL